MKKWIFALLLVSGGLFWLLSARVQSEEQIVGSYTGTYKGYNERVELTKDHKFSQVLRIPNGDTIKNFGTWKLTNRAIDFDGYMIFIDTEVDAPLDKPKKYSSFTFTAYRGMLVWDWDSGFYKLDQE
jgi:hypothetical protein